MRLEEEVGGEPPGAWIVAERHVAGDEARVEQPPTVDDEPVALALDRGDLFKGGTARRDIAFGARRNAPRGGNERTGGLGLAPLLVWAALGMLQVASVLVVPGMLISILPTVFAAQAEQSVASEAAIIGAQLSVHCPTPPPVLIGTDFTCSATSTAGHDLTVTVSLQRANGWIDWRVDDWGNTFAK